MSATQFDVCLKGLPLVCQGLSRLVGEMREVRTVEVTGVTHAKSGICISPDRCSMKPDSPNSVNPVATTSSILRVVMLVTLGYEGRLEHLLAGEVNSLRVPGIASNRDYREPRATSTAASLGKGTRLVVLLGTPSKDFFLDIACAVKSGIQVFVSGAGGIDDVRAGLIAAQKGYSYCSPFLFPCIMGAPVEEDQGNRWEESLRRLYMAEDAPHSTVDKVWDMLSQRQRDVALLAGAGLSNDEIGNQLFIDVTTVKSHLTEVYRKLRICRRSQIGPLMGKGIGEIGSPLMRS